LPIVKIVNVISTADTGQSVDLIRLNEYSWGKFDPNSYPAGYVKDARIKGRVTVFHTGKLISVGATSAETSFTQLKHAVSLLAQADLIKQVKLEPKIRNMVATLNIERRIDIYRLVGEAKNVIYEPDQFPGAIIRLKDPIGVSILAFSSGKFVIAGLRSEGDLPKSVDTVLSLTEKYFLKEKEQPLT